MQPLSRAQAQRDCAQGVGLYLGGKAVLLCMLSTTEIGNVSRAGPTAYVYAYPVET